MQTSFKYSKCIEIFWMPDFLRRGECLQWGKPRFLNVTSYECRNVGIPDNWFISQIFTYVERCGLKYTISSKTYKQFYNRSHWFQQGIVGF